MIIAYLISKSAVQYMKHYILLHSVKVLLFSGLYSHLRKHISLGIQKKQTYSILLYQNISRPIYGTQYRCVPVKVVVYLSLQSSTMNAESR